MQVLFCSPLDCRQGAWKECGKYEEENTFRYQRLMDCPVLSDGENVITDSSCSTRSGQNGSCGSTGSKVCGVSVLHNPYRCDDGICVYKYQEVERRISDHICDGKTQKAFTEKGI